MQWWRGGGHPLRHGTRHAKRLYPFRDVERHITDLVGHDRMTGWVWPESEKWKRELQD